MHSTGQPVSKKQCEVCCTVLQLFSLASFFLSDFIWDFGKLPFPTHLGKYFIRIGKIRAKIHEIGKIKAIFGLGMTPIYGLKNGQIKSLFLHTECRHLSVHHGRRSFRVLNSVLVQNLLRFCPNKGQRNTHKKRHINVFYSKTPSYKKSISK